MPWLTTTPMDQRLQFIADCQRASFSIRELCDRYGISRKTGYKWLAAYAREGPGGLADHSRRPNRSPTATPEAVRAAVLACRTAHPTWGPKKLLAVLHRAQPQRRWPGLSTAARLLAQAHLVHGRRRRERPPRPVTASRVTPTAPNAVWATDFKGQFRTGDGVYCYPLTVMDGFSRYLLACEGMAQITSREARACFERIFRTFGLPEVMRSDNGGPFASPALAGLSRLSVWWVQLGIGLDRIRPGHPEENGRLERFHRTLKAETAYPPASCGRLQQQRFNAFGWSYNYERPHEALRLRTPAERYEASPRPFPSRLPTPEYPGHWEIRRVGSNGQVHWHGDGVFLSEVLTGHDVGFEPIDDGVWTVYFYALPIARFDERTRRVADAPERC